MTQTRRRVLAALAIATAVASSSHAPVDAAPDGMPRVPRLMYWAWERPEDLRRIGAGAGVAFLAATYQIRGDRIDVAMRHQPLEVNPSTPLMAVVRIETRLSDRVTLDGAAQHRLATSIASVRMQPGVIALQIDFDAVKSERPFYRDLLIGIRRAIGAFPLSMTALASWCMDDDWIEGLPVDEAVPMLFRMGPVNDAFADAGVRARMHAPACAGAVGVSTDEPTPVLRGSRRTYIFHPTSWTDDALARAATEVMR